MVNTQPPPANPPSRRKNAPGGRSIRHVVKLTPTEEKALALRANSRSVTVARLLAEAALGTLPATKNTAPTTEVFAIRRQLQGVSTNLNQLARDYNSGVAFPDTDLDETRAAVRDCVQRVNTWLEANP